ncbi:MAG: GIY-YIG nuclease family protein [Candidatus Margulisbacteria bacterium]|nr:GIY-YIG nuclease family protein [Candidatus Margulisiibacteriota bacterium]
MSYFVYILECESKALYTGITTDLERRFAEHKRGKGGHYTSSNPPVKILYSEEHGSRSDATKREIQIKRWSRTKKIALIEGEDWVIKAASKCKN